MASVHEHGRDERVLVLKSGRIRLGGMRAIDCAVLNVSPSGACILTPRDTAFPTRFELVVDPDPTSRACTVMWREGARVGVKFSTQESEPEDQP